MQKGYLHDVLPARNIYNQARYDLVLSIKSLQTEGRRIRPGFLKATAENDISTLDQSLPRVRWERVRVGITNSVREARNLANGAIQGPHRRRYSKFACSIGPWFPAVIARLLAFNSFTSQARLNHPASTSFTEHVLSGWNWVEQGEGADTQTPVTKDAIGCDRT